MPCPEPRGRYEAARVHYTSRRSSGVAAHGTCAAARALTSNRAIHELARRRCLVETLYCGVPARARGALGWIEGRNVHIDYRWATADPLSIPNSVAELVALAPDVILASATEALAACQKATSTIPIVFVSVSDPVGQGFVTSLDRPGGHITGFTAFEFSMGGKWMELLKEIVPSIRHVAVLFNPKTAPYFPLFLRSIETAATSFGVELTPAPVKDLV